MFEVYEIAADGLIAHWGVGVTLADAMHIAALAIVESTDGLINYVNDQQVLAEFMQTAGVTLHFAYRAQ